MGANGIGQDGFFTLHRFGLLFLSLGLVVVVLELVRRGHLKERYALLWLAVSGFGLLVGLFPQIIVWLARLFEFQYLTVVSFFAFLFLLMLVLAFTVVISRISERNRILAQELALLAQRVAQLESDDDGHA